MLLSLGHAGLAAVGGLADLGYVETWDRTGGGAGTRPAYLEFLNVWRNADPGIPILKQAKAEYAKLQ